MRIPIGEPVIQLEGVAFSAKNLRGEYFNIKLRGDKAVLRTTLHREREGEPKGVKKIFLQEDKS